MIPNVQRRRVSNDTEVVVVGAGFAGASTAAALARAGMRNSVLLERESVPGTHASGRNAAIARQVEADAAIGKLAIRGLRQMRERRVGGECVVRESGGLYLLDARDPQAASRWTGEMAAQRVPFEVLGAVEARRRFPFLDGLEFGSAIYSATDGVVDIHALLTDLLDESRRFGVEVVTDCAVESIVVDAGAVRGVRTAEGEIRCRVVVDATGAWAGQLGRGGLPLPLRPLRRHLFVSSDTEVLPRQGPFVWHLNAGYYARTEGAGLLLCPCDESEHAPGVPDVDFDAEVLLADKLMEHAPGLAHLAVRRAWACLRTFAPDRRPVIGWDPEVAGLFHVSGLGGFGMTTSLAVGEAASTLLMGGTVDWMDAAAFSPAREALRVAACR